MNKHPLFSTTKWVVLCSLIFLFSCSPKKSEIDVPTLVERVEMAKLFAKVKGQIDRITDSGTLYGYYLNFPDSISSAFSDNDALEKWYENLLSNMGLKQLSAMAFKTKDHGLNPEYYHASKIYSISQKIETHKWDTVAQIPYDSLALFLLLSADGIMGMYHDMSSGRVNPSYTGSIDALPRRPCGNLKSLMH